MEEKIQNLMAKLNISRAEAIELMDEDKRIDRGEKLYELPDELKAGAKKARQADRKSTERKPREKKVDNDKLTIIQTLVDVLTVNSGCAHLADDLEVLNPEREFLFTYNGKKYKVVLSCPRSQHLRGWLN